MMKRPILKIRKGDTVQVITGSSKGQRGLVKKVFVSESKVIVEGINVVTRHIRPDYRYPQGSVTKEMPIHISNVALVDNETNKPGKVGFKKDENGKKIRFFKKTGSNVPQAV
ncbi:MAG: 50S ribosomal protein L24 [Alphaproteobacteria bacterium]|nr:50S ribosomal protein L24 [Alphaproteobacteria bacterium]